MSASGDSSMVSLTSVQVPDHLHRNAREVLDAGIENGGQFLLELLARRLGRSDLRDVALLDADDEVNDEIDDAYRAKYGRHSSYVRPMVAPPARATTLRLVPSAR